MKIFMEVYTASKYETKNKTNNQKVKKIVLL